LALLVCPRRSRAPVISGLALGVLTIPSSAFRPFTPVQPRRHRVELSDVPEREVPQERPERRRGPDPGEQAAGRAVPQQGHVIDRVGAGDHARDSAGTFTPAPEPPGLPIRTCSAERS
jgi:hypothetical protein